MGITVDNSGNLYVTDSYNNTIREITPAGVVTTITGLANQKGSTDGIGSVASFYFPSGITIDSSGNLYVVDDGNCTIRKITFQLVTPSPTPTATETPSPSPSPTATAINPTSAQLAGFALSAGTLAPPFDANIYAYTASVGYNQSSITVTATTEDSRAAIAVNGVPATSGQPSAPVNLNVGHHRPGDPVYRGSAKL